MDKAANIGLEGQALDDETRVALFKDLLYVRRVEERIIALYSEQEMRCPTHFSIGQEAVSAGVSAHLSKDDYAISAHRSHAHYLNKGGDIRAMFAELYGKSTGSARGKGGSMHLIDLAVNFLGCVPIVGSTIPIGVGAAFGAALQHQDRMSAVYFGDGATEAGVFYEAMNWAVLQNLAVLFVCENNQYSVHTPLSLRQPEFRSIKNVAEVMGVRAFAGDGQLVEDVYRLAERAIAHIRSGGGPALIEFQTYRWLQHCGPLPDLHLGYRPPGEFEAWTARCPVTLQREQLLRKQLLDAKKIAKMEGEIAAVIDDAISFAKSSPYPAREALHADLYA